MSNSNAQETIRKLREKYGAGSDAKTEQTQPVSKSAQIVSAMRTKYGAGSDAGRSTAPTRFGPTAKTERILPSEEKQAGTFKPVAVGTGRENESFTSGNVRGGGRWTAQRVAERHGELSDALEQARADALSATERTEAAKAAHRQILDARAHNTSTAEWEADLLRETGFASFEELKRYVDNPPSTESLQQKVDTLEKGATDFAGTYYHVAGQEADDTLSSGKRANLYRQAVYAAIEAQSLMDRYRNGGWNNEATSEYAAAVQKKVEMVAELEAAGYERSVIDRALEYAVRKSREERTAKSEESLAQYAKENPVAASAISVGTGVAQGTDYVKSLVKSAGHSNPNDLENYKPLSKADMQFTGMTGALRGGVTQRIEEDIDNETLEKAATFAYQTGMSIADSMSLTLTLGPAASVVMGSGAAANATRDAVERGGTNRQALTLGLAAGVAELMFERISIGNLLDDTKLVTNAKQWALETIKQAGVEASEEMATEVANIIADAAIMGRNSNSQRAREQYLAQGMTPEQAERQVFLDNLESVGLAGLGGALSGGVSGGAVNAVNFTSYRANPNAQAPTETQQTNAPTQQTPTIEQKPTQESAPVQPGVVSPTMQESAQSATVADSATVENVGQTAKNFSVPGNVRDMRTSTDGKASVPFAREDMEFLGAMSEATGVPVNIVDATDGEDGWYENGEIFIAANAEDPINWVATHEVTHHLEKAAPEAYSKYLNYVQQFLENEGTLDERVQKIRQHYASKNIELTEDAALREVAANFTERLRVDQDLFRRVAQEDRSLAQRLLDGLKEFIRRVQARLHGKDVAALERTRQAWEHALRESKGKTVEDGERQYLFFAGKDSLDKAAEKTPDSKLKYEEKNLSRDSSLYNYEFLTSLPDMNVTALPDLEAVRGENGKIESRRVIDLGLENAEKNGAVVEGRVYVENDYTGKRLLVTASGIRHGLNGSKYRLMTNARLGAVVGDLLKNAVPINALNNTAENVDGTYAMVAYAADENEREVISVITVEQIDGSVSGIESFDVLHAVSGRQKNSSQADTKSQGLIPIKATKISIADLLDIVKTTHQSILSKDVLEKLGEKRNLDGDYADKVKFSLRGAREAEYQAIENAQLAGMMSQGRADAERVRKANERVEKIRKDRDEAIDALNKQAAEDIESAKLAGMMSQGRKDAAELRKAEQKIEDIRKERDAKIEELQKKAAQDIRDAKLAGAMAQGKKDAAQIRKAKETTDEVRRKRDEAIKELKQKQRDREAAMRESRDATSIRKKIQRHVNDMSAKLRNPTDKKHIPEELRGPVAKLLESINMESKDGAPTKRTQAFAELKKAYSEIAESMVVDPDLLSADGAVGLFDEVIAMADKRISEMSVDELETVWNTIRAVEASIRNANKTFAANRYKTVQEAAQALWNENVRKKDKGYRGIVGSLLDVDMLTPQAFFHRLGSAGDAMFQSMRAAQDKHIRLMKEVSDFTHETLNKKDTDKWEKELHTVTLGGQQVEMSSAQLMELYALMRRKQAMEHLLKGGILPDAIVKKGKKSAGSEAIRGLTADELMEATSKLTDEQVQVAELLQEYASSTLADFGNEASMEVYGYRKFGEEHYWPIRSNRAELKSDIQKDTQVTSVANRGFTKNVKPNAKNSVQIGSIFDTFASHASDMATYSAWLGTSEDVNRIRNFTYKAENDDGSLRTIGTVKGLLDRAFGTGKGQSYLQKLLSDIAIGVKGTNDPNAPLTSGLVGNYKAASIGANLRVVIQQPTAILRALEVLNPKYLASGVGLKRAMKAFETAKEYAPIAVWKDWGYFDIHTGRQMKDVLFETDTALDKVKEVSMWPAGKADSWAWGMLWLACESEVKDTTNLHPGTDEFYKKVAERFNEVIDKTQVVDGILQRSQIMRSGDNFMKMATSFMAEPTKQYNMFLSAIHDAKNTPEGKKRIARTSAALATSALLNVVAQSLVDAWRDDDREKKYLEKVLKAATGIGGDSDSGLKNFLGSNLFNAANPLGYIPFVKDAWSVINDYDVSRMDMDSIDRTVSSAKNLMKALQGKGKTATGNAVVSFIAESSRLIGVPLANVKRDIVGLALSAASGGDNRLLEYRTRKILYRVTENTTMFYDVLYDAMKTDKEAYRIIYKDMLKSGLTEEKIKKGMEDRMKKDQGVKSVDQLKSRWTPPK